MPRFSVDVQQTNGTTLLTVRGELDLAATELAERELLAAEEAEAEQIVVDLAEVEFIDSSGLRILLSAADRAREAGRRFVAARPSGQVSRLLEMTASDDLVEVSERLPAPFDGNAG